MLDSNKICDKCKSTYDINDATCPNCGDIKRNDRSKYVINVSIIKQLLLFFVGFMGFQIITTIVSFLLMGMIEADTIKEALKLYNDNPFYQMSTMLISYLAMFVIMVIILLPNFKTVFKHFNKEKNILKGFVIGMLLVIASALYSRLISFVGSNDNQNAAVNLIANYPLFGILIIAFVGPICEEFTYRLGLFSSLSRIGRKKAYIISALIFALMHFNFANPYILVEILNLPPYIISGLILTYTYEKYGFEAAITTHIFNNLFSTISIIIGVNA